MTSASPTYRIRPVIRADYEALAPLVSQMEVAPITAENLWKRDQKNVGATTERFVAETDGGLVGYSRAIHMPNNAPGWFWLTAMVTETHRGAGIGRALASAAETFALEHGAAVLDTEVRDNDVLSQNFAERRGYSVFCQHFESSIVPKEFDSAPYLTLLKRLRSEGIRFVPYSETDGSEEAQRSLWKVNAETAKDVPNSDDFGDWPFEQFQREVFQSHWFRPECQILAFDGDHAVGLGAIGELSAGVFYNTFTGVRREYRGRGIATALKVLSLETASQLDARELVTHNDSMNHSMLAINRKLGYQRRGAGYFRVRKEIK